MTSIMTKTFVISQGIEWKSYLFCWLCVITDFFYIFFIVSWLFLNSEHLDANFLGYFSIIGEVWCYKVMISILPPIVIAIVCYFTVGWWVALYFIWYENKRYWKWWQIVGTQFFFLILGQPIGIACFCVAAIVFGLLFEITCFTMFSFVIFFIFTSERWEYREKVVSNFVKEVLSFVSNATHINNDRIIRILSVNYSYYYHFDNDIRHDMRSKNRNYAVSFWDDKLYEYIKDNHKNETLNKITYKEDQDSELEWDVLICSYDIAMIERACIRKIKWNYIK